MALRGLVLPFPAAAFRRVDSKAFDFSSSIKSQRATFPSVVPYLAFLPTYSTGMLSFSLASAETRHQARDIVPADLRYLNSDVLNAAFALPTFVQNLIED